MVRNYVSRRESPQTVIAAVFSFAGGNCIKTKFICLFICHSSHKNRNSTHSECLPVLTDQTVSHTGKQLPLLVWNFCGLEDEKLV